MTWVPERQKTSFYVYYIERLKFPSWMTHPCLHHTFKNVNYLTPRAEVFSHDCYQVNSKRNDNKVPMLTANVSAFISVSFYWTPVEHILLLFPYTFSFLFIPWNFFDTGTHSYCEKCKIWKIRTIHVSPVDSVVEYPSCFQNMEAIKINIETFSAFNKRVLCKHSGA